MFDQIDLSGIITKKRLIIGAVIVTILLIIATIIWFFSTNNGTIVITVVPDDATISINGQPAEHGENVVEPGQYQVNIRREGFESIQESVIINRGDKIFIDKIMTSDDQELVDSILQQPSNQQNAQNITSRQYTSESNKLQDEFPIAKELGSYDAAWGFEVNYGQSKTGVGYALYVNLLNSSAKQKFIDWLYSIGYVESDLEIHYTEKWR